jgi:hypothetical protein
VLVDAMVIYFSACRSGYALIRFWVLSIEVALRRQREDVIDYTSGSTNLLGTRHQCRCLQNAQASGTMQGLDVVPLRNICPLTCEDSDA